MGQVTYRMYTAAGEWIATVPAVFVQEAQERGAAREHEEQRGVFVMTDDLAIEAPPSGIVLYLWRGFYFRAFH